MVSAVDQALEAGKQAIYISLGTVATSDYFYLKPFGHFGRDNGLTDSTGKQVAQYIFSFEGFGNREDVIVVLSLGPQEDILDDLPPLPRNFIAGKSMPQLQLLKRCSAFLTHGGANSMHESLGHGVPRVVVPMFGDQPINGDAIVNCGAGFNFRLPMQSVTPEALRTAVHRLLEPGQSDERCNSYRESARSMAQKIADAGGSAEAAGRLSEPGRGRKKPYLGSWAILGHASRPELRRRPATVWISLISHWCERGPLLCTGGSHLSFMQLLNRGTRQ